MKKELTELVFILDKSGSMSGLEADTIGGFNAMLEKQKAVEGECRITTVLFDDRYYILHDRINIQTVSPITGEGILSAVRQHCLMQSARPFIKLAMLKNTRPAICVQTR
jgi:hypothetical protein